MLPPDRFELSQLNRCGRRRAASREDRQRLVVLVGPEFARHVNTAVIREDLHRRAVHDRAQADAAIHCLKRRFLFAENQSLPLCVVNQLFATNDQTNFFRITHLELDVDVEKFALDARRRLDAAHGNRDFRDVSDLSTSGIDRTA